MGRIIARAGDFRDFALDRFREYDLAIFEKCCLISGNGGGQLCRRLNPKIALPIFHLAVSNSKSASALFD
jgi:hypothetical protein